MAASRSNSDFAGPWEYAFDRWAKDKLAQLQMQITEGGASDYANYRELVGEIRGIQNCMAELISIRDRLAEEAGDKK